MNIFTIVVVGYIIVATILIYFIYRDQRQPKVFFGKHKKLAWILILFLALSGSIAYYTRFVEPFTIITKQSEIKISGIKTPIKIVLITDPQFNHNKNFSWIYKIDWDIQTVNPDIVIFDGDLISNEGTTYDQIYSNSPGDSSTADEVGILSHWANLPALSYFTLGNHEYGLGDASRSKPKNWTGTRALEVKEAMELAGAKPLINHLDCPIIKNQKICFFGIDDLWGAEVGLTKIDFSELKNWDQKTPLIFATHNPDGILDWPKDIKKPDLVLAGHTHGGQVYLPFIGPLGDAGIELGKGYYRGLNYYQGTPIYTSFGLGESGGPVRFMTAPELTVITLQP